MATLNGFAYLLVKTVRQDLVFLRFSVKIIALTLKVLDGSDEYFKLVTRKLKIILGGGNVKLDLFRFVKPERYVRAFLFLIERKTLPCLFRVL